QPGAGASSQATRSKRQMDVYYNMLNIFGDRMRDNPSTKVTLVGSSDNVQDGQIMANEVKDYLVNTFGIAADRIETKGQKRPENPSGTRNTPKDDLDLVREENRRIEILTNDEELLKPVEIRVKQQEPLDNDIVLNLKSDASIKEWMVTINGEGKNETY